VRSATKQTLSGRIEGRQADARKLAELLRTGMLRSVWHGRQTTRGLKEMVRAYETFAMDTTRAMMRIKALYRSRGIATKAVTGRLTVISESACGPKPLFRITDLINN
jgi:hypothetical protein